LSWGPNYICSAYVMPKDRKKEAFLKCPWIIWRCIEMDVDVDDADGKWEWEWKWRSCSCDKPYLQQLPPRCGNSGNGSYTYHAQKYATLLSA